MKGSNPLTSMSRTAAGLATRSPPAPRISRSRFVRISLADRGRRPTRRGAVGRSSPSRRASLRRDRSDSWRPPLAPQAVVIDFRSAWASRMDVANAEITEGCAKRRTAYAVAERKRNAPSPTDGRGVSHPYLAYGRPRALDVRVSARLINESSRRSRVRCRALPRTMARRVFTEFTAAVPFEATVATVVDVVPHAFGLTRGAARGRSGGDSASDVSTRAGT